MRKLSSLTGASRPTIKKAIAQLEKEWHCKRHLKYSPASPSFNLKKKYYLPKPSYIKIAHSIRCDIQSGILNPGDYLPKISMYTEREKTSRKAVLDAYNLLANEGWIFKKSRRYIVGRDKTTTPRFLSSAYPPVTLIMCYDENRWPRYCLDRRNGPFGATFVQLAEKSGFRLEQIIPTRKQTSYKVPSGKTDFGVRDKIVIDKCVSDPFFSDSKIEIVFFDE